MTDDTAQAPTYAPTAKRIAYAGFDGHQDQIVTINVDGGRRRQVTHNYAEHYQPAWSPNGKQIAFQSFDGNDFEIVTIKATGGGRRQVTHNRTDDIEPSWGVGVR